jgi:hypothetical protein
MNENEMQLDKINDKKGSEAVRLTKEDDGIDQIFHLLKAYSNQPLVLHIYFKVLASVARLQCESSRFERKKEERNRWWK